ncbi:MAG TPA: metallophosphoesterase family protein [Rhizomicrobium sp.]|nr:metallophosphoesterase family protein [Rhizomicrobium sp.]
MRGLFSRPAGEPEREQHHRVYAVGDVHGRLDLLQILLDKILEDAASVPTTNSLVFVGDYIDRGPDSRGVVELLSHPLEGFETYCLRGNHDQALLDFLEEPASYRRWKRFGAAETLLSYGVEPPSDDENSIELARDELAERIPETHLQFFRELQSHVQIGNYHFVHAGARPGVALEDQSLEDMMWIRNEFLESEEDFGKIVVHGHTPTDRPVCRPNRIGIDTGAFATNCLTAVVLDGPGIRFLQT